MARRDATDDGPVGRSRVYSGRAVIALDRSILTRGGRHDPRQKC
jgi:hypothetical protein